MHIPILFLEKNHAHYFLIKCPLGNICIHAMNHQVCITPGGNFGIITAYENKNIHVINNLCKILC